MEEFTNYTWTGSVGLLRMSRHSFNTSIAVPVVCQQCENVSEHLLNILFSLLLADGVDAEEAGSLWGNGFSEGVKLHIRRGELLSGGVGVRSQEEGLLCSTIKGGEQGRRRPAEAAVSGAKGPKLQLLLTNKQ